MSGVAWLLLSHEHASGDAGGKRNAKHGQEPRGNKNRYRQLVQHKTQVCTALGKARGCAVWYQF